MVTQKRCVILIDGSNFYFKLKDLKLHAKLTPIARDVIEVLKKENSSLVTDRVSLKQDGQKSQVVQVVTDRERFIQEMVKRGTKLKPPN